MRPAYTTPIITWFLPFGAERKLQVKLGVAIIDILSARVVA